MFSGRDPYFLPEGVGYPRPPSSYLTDTQDFSPDGCFVITTRLSSALTTSRFSGFNDIGGLLKYTAMRFNRENGFVYYSSKSQLKTIVAYLEQQCTDETRKEVVHACKKFHCVYKYTNSTL